jgi:integrase/recombinase XerC
VFNLAVCPQGADTRLELGDSTVTICDIARLTADIDPAWAGFITDWHRTLRAANHPETTRYNYLLAVNQLARYLSDPSLVDPSPARTDPRVVIKSQLETFQTWMIDTRSAATALNKHKALTQFFTWLEKDEEEIDQSPMRRVRQPSVPTKLVPIIRDDDTARILATCRPKTFANLRDEAIIRLYYNTAARLSEVANLTVGDIDLKTDRIHYEGKGRKHREVRFGPRTGRALSRYLRCRSGHAAADAPFVWLAERGTARLQANGIKIMLKRRGRLAGITGAVHAHRWRHNYAHEWKLAGGDTGDLMVVMGWSSEEMAYHYGASASAERAKHTQARLGIGDNV